VTVSGELAGRPVEGVGEVRNDPGRDPIVEDDVSCFTVPIRHDIWTAQIVVG
jgi:hypothetical protein